MANSKFAQNHFRECSQRRCRGPSRTAHGGHDAWEFENNSFDLAVSNVAIHNVKGEAKKKAIAEARSRKAEGTCC
jgi:hypothetical protein